MVPLRAPPVDTRSFERLVEETETLLRRYSAWRPVEDGDDPARALVRVFARLVELVIDRLNRVPEKNLLAFLDLVGVEPLAPQPARTPLTFQLAGGSLTDALAPAGTQVAAAPTEGESEPAIFETERELVVTRTQLVAVYTREPAADRYSDHTAVATGQASSLPAGSGFPVFQGQAPIEHCLYLGHSALFGIAAPKTIALVFRLATVAPAWPADVDWTYWDGTAWVAPPSVSAPVAAGVSPVVPGAVWQLAPSAVWTVTLSGVPAVPESVVDGRGSAWLRGRLRSLASGRAIPEVDTIQASVRVQRADLSPDRAAVNDTEVDLSRDFYPFGVQPRFNDTFYLAAGEAFSRPGAAVTLTVSVTNPSNPDGSPPPAVASDDLILDWEFWNRVAGRWQLLGESRKNPTSGPPGRSSPFGFVDGTAAFASNGAITFTCPATIGPAEVNGVPAHWIRARLTSGDYGQEARFTPVLDRGGQPQTDPLTGSTLYRQVGSGLRPPSVKTLTVGYDVPPALTPLDHVLSENDFRFVDFSAAARGAGPPHFRPYTPSGDTRPTLYLGFDRPGDTNGFANRATAIYCSVADVAYDPAAATEESVAGGGVPGVFAPAVPWEYWSGTGWARLGTRDETANLTRRGLVAFVGPPDFLASTEFGRTAFWLRARWDGGRYRFPPRLRRVQLNTTWATHARTVRDEILGSSAGERAAVLRTASVPVLPGLRLVVREPELPSGPERQAIEAEEGPEAVSTVPAGAGDPPEVWVGWHQVPDFYASGPRSRHYTLDWRTGEVRFGDGRHGLSLPQGNASVRGTYRTGGGRAGNRPAGGISQLKTAVPYVAGVTNSEPSSGGADGESLAAVTTRGPKTLRHRDRAVVIADFEDLALQAAVDVARVKGIGARSAGDAGSVSIVVVPPGEGPKPVPTVELLDRVRDYVQARRPPAVQVWVEGPDWLQVTVTAEIVPTSIEAASDTQAAVLVRLAGFLHPLTGGPDATGWAFGRKPHRSDLFALVEGTPGVDHVRRLSVTEQPDPPGVRPDRFLVYAGDHQISIISPETG